MEALTYSLENELKRIKSEQERKVREQSKAFSQ